MFEIFSSIAQIDFMAKPKAYGAFHLTFMLVGFLLCVLLAFVLRKTTNKVNDCILFSCGLFLALTEVYKQLFYYYCMGDGVGYEWWIFPFQLCSLPMYLCLIVPFIKKNRIKRAMYTFLATYNLLGGFISFFEPSGLVHEHLTLTLHAFIWHMMLVFLGFYLIASGRSGRKLRDFCDSAIVFVSACAVAFIINLSLRDVSGATVNMFYVGPSISPIIVFKTVAQTLGWYINTPFYMFALTLGAFIFFLPAYIFERRAKKKAQ